MFGATPMCGTISVMCSKHAFDQNVGHTNKSTFNNDECCIFVRDEVSDENGRISIGIYVRKYSVEWAHLPVLNDVFSKVKQINFNPCSMEIVFKVLPTIQG